MSLAIVLAALALLVVLIALVEATASRLALPQSVMLAGLGILLGLLPVYGTGHAALAPLAALFGELPLSADAIALLLLPPLLFDAALRIDARRMLDDAAPIFLLAVVAVCVTTFAVGLALAPLGIAPLLVCLLLGAIVSTTDPLAVLSIFRDVGAPARLVRIVEGESLLNDAAAIALFTILLGAVAAGGGVSLADGVVVFLTTGIGGLAVGAAAGFSAAFAIALTRHHPAGRLTSVTVALPYLCTTSLRGDPRNLRRDGVVAAASFTAPGPVGPQPARIRGASSGNDLGPALLSGPTRSSSSLAGLLPCVPTLCTRFDAGSRFAAPRRPRRSPCSPGARPHPAWGFLRSSSGRARPAHRDHRGRRRLLWSESLGWRGGTLTLNRCLRPLVVGRNRTDKQHRADAYTPEPFVRARSYATGFLSADFTLYLRERGAFTLIPLQTADFSLFLASAVVVTFDRKFGLEVGAFGEGLGRKAGVLPPGTLVHARFSTAEDAPVSSGIACPRSARFQRRTRR